MMTRLQPVFQFEPLQLCDKHEKVRSVAVDRRELHIATMTSGLRVYLYSLRTLEKLCFIELKHQIQGFTEDDFQLTFSRHSKLLFVWGEEGIIVIRIVFDYENTMLQLSHYYKQLDISKLVANPFHTHEVVVISNGSLQACNIKNPNQISLAPIRLEKLRTVQPQKSIQPEEGKVPNKIPMELIGYSDDDQSQAMEEEGGVVFDMTIVTEGSSKTCSYIIVILEDGIQVLIQERDQQAIGYRVHSTLDQIEKDGKYLGMAYEESSRILSVYDPLHVSLYKLDSEFKISCLQYKVSQLVERILHGVFVTVPYHLAHRYSEPYLFTFSGVCKGKLGTLMGIFSPTGEFLHETMQNQDKKTSQLIPVFKWDAAIIVLFDNGTMNILRMYKHSQWEDLDFKFRYVMNNEIYVEREEEFDLEVKPPQQDLSPTIFSKEIYCPTKEK